MSNSQDCAEEPFKHSSLLIDYTWGWGPPRCVCVCVVTEGRFSGSERKGRITGEKSDLKGEWWTAVCPAQLGESEVCIKYQEIQGWWSTNDLTCRSHYNHIPAIQDGHARTHARTGHHFGSVYLKITRGKYEYELTGWGFLIPIINDTCIVKVDQVRKMGRCRWRCLTQIQEVHFSSCLIRIIRRSKLLMHISTLAFGPLRRGFFSLGFERVWNTTSSFMWHHGDIMVISDVRVPVLLLLLVRISWSLSCSLSARFLSRCSCRFRSFSCRWTHTHTHTDKDLLFNYYFSCVAALKLLLKI